MKFVLFTKFQSSVKNKCNLLWEVQFIDVHLLLGSLFLFLRNISVKLNDSRFDFPFGFNSIFLESTCCVIFISVSFSYKHESVYQGAPVNCLLQLNFLIKTGLYLRVLQIIVFCCSNFHCAHWVLVDVNYCGFYKDSQAHRSSDYEHLR